MRSPSGRGAVRFRSLGTALPVAVVLMGLLPAAATADDALPSAVGATCPDFVLFDQQDHRVRLGDIHEPVIVLNFWAFWCETWIAELPQLRELAAQQEALGFRLLAVSVDGKWRDQICVVCGEQELAFPALIDRGSRLTRELHVRRVPTVLVIGRDRRVRYVHESYPGNPGVLQAIREAASAHRPQP